MAFARFTYRYDMALANMRQNGAADEVGDFAVPSRHLGEAGASRCRHSEVSLTATLIGARDT
jgi:hypothetical protein